ncbi:MAG: GNAT family N-acetyltransferase [Candidatus Magasanikbacteria bacterium]|nr:GNAT family N-acetyltransferase [Candidatus Magasanikbacteria bacterium]
MADSGQPVDGTVITIREARADDFEFVAKLMKVALDPWYDGDHLAHAQRIFDAHMAGGADHVGHFSAEQHMFVLEVDGVRAGMVHLVIKKQGTAKISPLIVDPKFQVSHKGLGSRLQKTLIVSTFQWSSSTRRCMDNKFVSSFSKNSCRISTAWTIRGWMRCSQVTIGGIVAK